MKRHKKHMLHFISSSLMLLASIFGTGASLGFWNDIEVPECLIK